MPADRPSTWHWVIADPRTDGTLRLTVVWQPGCRTTDFHRCCDLTQHVRLDGLAGRPWVDITAPGVYRARVTPGTDTIAVAVDLVHS